MITNLKLSLLALIICVTVVAVLMIYISDTDDQSLYAIDFSHHQEIVRELVANFKKAKNEKNRAIDEEKVDLATIGKYNIDKLKSKSADDKYFRSVMNCCSRQAVPDVCLNICGRLPEEGGKADIKHFLCPKQCLQFANQASYCFMNGQNMEPCCMDYHLDTFCTNLCDGSPEAVQMRDIVDPKHISQTLKCAKYERRTIIEKCSREAWKSGKENWILDLEFIKSESLDHIPFQCFANK